MQSKAVEPEHGIWLVWGNHDHYLGERLEELAEKISAKGINVLANEWDTIPFGDKRLNIIGIDDFCLGKSDIARSFQGVEDGVNLVLSHDPNIVLHLEEHHEVDYLLSGHLHGNQIKIPGAFKLFPMGELPKVNVIAGMHKVNGKTLYISEGMGQAGLNIRLGTRPEITIHTLRTSVGCFFVMSHCLDHRGDVFHFEERLDAVETAFTTQAGFLQAAKRCLHRACRQRIVQTDDAVFSLLSCGTAREMFWCRHTQPDRSRSCSRVPALLLRFQT